MQSSTHLSTSALHNALQRLEDTLAGQIESSTTTADRHEVFSSGVSASGICSGFAGSSFGSGGILGGNDGDCVVVCLGEGIRVLFNWKY
jgi:hypothetical protein